MARRSGFGGRHFDPEIKAQKGLDRLESRIRLGITLQGRTVKTKWGPRGGFSAAGIFRIGAEFRDRIGEGVGGWGVKTPPRRRIFGKRIKSHPERKIEEKAR